MTNIRPELGERPRVNPEEVDEKEKITDKYELHVIPTAGKIGNESVDHLKEWHKLRTEFVLNSGWLTEDELNFEGQVVDYDRYDLSDYKTFNVLVYDNEGIAAGARLTQPKSPTDFLSRDMIEKSPAMRADFDEAMERIDAEELIEEGRLWDVTRLIPNIRSFDRKELTEGSWREGMMRIFGAGVPLTADSEGKSAKWVFTTTTPVMKMLMKSGVHPIEIIASDELENHVGDSEKTLVCMLDVHDAFQSVLELANDNDESDRGVASARQIAKGFDMAVNNL